MHSEILWYLSLHFASTLAVIPNLIVQWLMASQGPVACQGDWEQSTRTSSLGRSLCAADSCLTPGVQSSGDACPQHHLINRASERNEHNVAGRSALSAIPFDADGCCACPQDFDQCCKALRMTTSRALPTSATWQLPHFILCMHMGLQVQLPFLLQKSLEETLEACFFM